MQPPHDAALRAYKARLQAMKRKLDRGVDLFLEGSALHQELEATIAPEHSFLGSVLTGGNPRLDIPAGNYVIVLHRGDDAEFEAALDEAWAAWRAAEMALWELGIPLHELLRH